MHEMGWQLRVRAEGFSASRVKELPRLRRRDLEVDDAAVLLHLPAVLVVRLVTGHPARPPSRCCQIGREVGYAA